MRQIAIILLMCATSLMAMADGWQYGSGKAGIESQYEFINGNYDRPTALQLFVGKDESGHDGVLAILQGECDIHDFRDSQQYVMIDFGDLERHQWAIQQVPYKNRNYNAFIFGDASNLIERLRECDTFTITLPLHGVGTRTFYFYTDGYPLDW